MLSFPTPRGKAYKALFVFLLGTSFLFQTEAVGQNVFRSVQDGDWDDESTWFSGGGAGGTEGVDFPSQYDTVYIDHDVEITATNSGSDFVFEGYLVISAGDTLECQVGNANNGFILQASGQMHNFGTFYTLDNSEDPDPNAHLPKEFILQDNSMFIGYTNSFTFIGDDWWMYDNARLHLQTNVCYAVSDDFNADGTGWTLTGSGDVRIGGDGANSVVAFSNGASVAQIQSGITIYRNVSALTCSGTSLAVGTGTSGFTPIAYDDFSSAQYNTAVNIDVLHQGQDDDAIIIGDTLTLTSAGVNGAVNDNATTQGGTLSINNNGTPANLTDDYIVYTPALNFTGTDDFQYIITNEDGGTDTATVTVFVACDGGQFVEAATTFGLNLGGAKDGGLTWYDFNRDNLIDVIVNTDDGTNDTRIYFQQTDGSFTDVTSTHAAALLSQNCERTVVAADFNNDGYIEFVRNTHNRVEVWQNDGPSATPAYSFSLVESYTSNSEGINVEGIGIVDWDQDGFLDLIMDTDDSEIVLYENDGDGSFTEQTSGTGLPTGDGGVGDYSVALDWNNDGFIDYAARKSDGGTSDFWEFNSGTGQFTALDPPDIATAGGEKGAITFCDVDQDGDFDFIWAHQSNDNETTIYTQADDGSFTEALSLVTDGGIEECDCADVDNDGDLDIFLGDDAGTSYLFKNNTTKGGALSFTQDNDCIDPDDDVEGSEFVDFDADGDMDLYMNINGAANQLWVNAQNDDNFLIVEPRIKLNGAGNWRPATGANVMLIACSDTCLIKDVSGGRGHGSQSPSKVHFGLGGTSLFGPDQEYSVAIFFPDSNGTRDTVLRTITPSNLLNQTLIVYQTDASDTLCPGTDTDGDGVADSQDPDDDNDGVLDINECLGELVVTTETGFFAAGNLNFTIAGNIAVRTDPQVLQAIAVLGTSYNQFILPDSFDINYTSLSFDEADARILDAGVSQSQLSVAGETSYETTGLLSFQDADLNHYQMLDTPVDSTDDYYDCYYDTPILSNGKVYIAFSERGGNNRFAFEAFAPDGTAYNQRVELALADYIDSGFPVAALGGGGSQNAEIAVLPITDLAPLGSTVGRIRTIPFTSGSDAGDGKIFIFGTLNSLSGTCDSDGDGVVNGLDLDSDNDGIPDLVESGGVDTNGDGTVDDLTDTDMDGLVDQFDTTNGGTLLPNLDSDNDGVYDKNDLDSDDDGIADVNEIGGTDENGDGRADDYVDTDSDGFGDVVDGDVGNDGTAENTANALAVTGADTDNDSRPNSFTEGDFDSDGLLAHIDIDSDNDGITDVMEVSGVDADSNGRYDNYVDNDHDGFNNLVDGDSTNALAFGSDANGNNFAAALVKTGADANLDGAPDSYPTGSSDADANRDFVDIDADNDGITDNTEGISTAGYTAPSGNDTDGDGLDDSYDPDNGGTYVYPVDTDSDGTDDYLDLDSDDDSITDDREGHDSDGNGQADASSPANTGVSGGTTDADADGLYDGWDNNTSSNDPTNTNLTPSSHPDVVNVGNDRDWREIRDWDGDGIGDLTDFDDDNDGILDLDENDSNNPDGDEDGDGILNWLDTTDDGNGGDGSTTNYTDANGDGIPDVYDFDEDGIPNHLDLDSDNDGITDLAENPSGTGVDANNDGIVDGSADADNDGILDSADSNDGLAGSPGSTIDDSDGDGVPDSQDLDSDNDGITDLVENPDGTGVDANNDGIVDGAADADRDGILDSADSDDANAGSPNSAPTDTDGDGVPNLIDLDSDNDGITDLVESGTGTDANNDGIVDGSTDTDGDGVLSSADSDDSTLGSVHTATNSDADAAPNYLDLDSDNDGINDLAESGTGTDANNDGVIDGSTDVDGDGVLATGDGDDANRGSINTPRNTDGNGPANYLDLDSDDDGISDLAESGTGTDANNDGIVDGTTDADGDGVLSSADSDEASFGSVHDPTNTDSDLLDNYLDLDSDNDGITDLAESGTGTDANNDGIVDGSTDVDGDGILSSADSDDSTVGSTNIPTNTDGDGLINSLDLDSDNDGITDLVESGTGSDSDNNGVVDFFLDNDLDGILNSADSDDATRGTPNTSPTNTDADGAADFIDLDSDNDGISDLTESGTGTDANNDGVVDGSTDADGDGVLSSADSDDSTRGSVHTPTNSDADAVANYLDLDSDNDGVLDLAESGTGTDANNDGIVDGATDNDGDGVIASADSDDSSYGSVHTPTDSDGTGPANYLDLDSDNDGITDRVESGQGIDAGNDGIVDGSTDTDGDGILDSEDNDDGAFGSPSQVALDTDLDGVINSQDIDSDNDGITDLTESGTGTDTNNDGVVDGTSDADGDGVITSADSDDSTLGSVHTPTNSDVEGFLSYPNYIDIDSDNDGIIDNIEAQASTLTPIVPGGADSDGDGLDDAFESTNGLTPVNTESTGDPDYIDSDTDDDGESDLIEGDDINDDGAADTAPSNIDTDGDGLDNSYDNINGWNSTTNVTNNGQDAFDFPDNDEGGSELDWREEPCANGLVILAPSGTTTSAPAKCKQSPWTYYYNASDPTQLLFGIEKFPSGGGANTSDFTATATLTVNTDPTTAAGVYSAEDIPGQQATFVMGRYWNVNITSGSMNGTVNVRFFYDPSELSIMETTAQAWNTANGGGSLVESGTMWFKTITILRELISAIVLN